MKESHSYIKLYFFGIVGFRFSNRAHYNEFVENGSKSWVLMRRRLVLGVKNTQNRMAQHSKKKGPLARGRELPTPLASQEPLSFLWAFFFFLSLRVISVVIYPFLPIPNSCDFGLPRTGSSSAIHFGSLDSLHSSSGTSSSSTWALGLKWNGSKPLKPFGLTIAPQNHAARLLRRGEGF